MEEPSQRPGKTAPRLLQDILDYDPAHPPGTRRNLLSEVPPVYPEHYSGPLDFISQRACRHYYVTKINQSALDQRSTDGASKVSAVCAKCRYHVQVIVAHTNGSNQQDQTFPGHVHHFVYRSGGQIGDGEEVTTKGQIAETFSYQCSFLTCSVEASVRVVSPILGPEMLQVLTDPERLRERVDEAVVSHPSRLKDVARPQVINVLENLRTYVSNALHGSSMSRSISAVNKKFMICFGVEGEPCRDLLEFLEFTFKDGGFWEPPRPVIASKLPYADGLKIFLDDVVYELSALIDQRPPSEKKNQQTTHSFRPAFEDISYALDSTSYPTAPRSREFQMAPAPYYEDLGAVEDMSSSMIIEACNRQVSVDPTRTPLYLKSLRSIGGLRGGEDEAIIDRAVQVAYAEGKYTSEDIVDAYDYFGLSHEDRNLTDDGIIGRFYDSLGTLGQSDETETRRRLWRIGDSRRSERIKYAAEERISTAEQAHAFLGVDEKLSDDFIITMFTAKVNDNPSSRILARHAVGLIAESRRSNVLRHFLKTGETGVGDMDVADAYRLLQIPDRTADDAAIMAAYTICVDEAPGQVETYNRALNIIAREKESSMLDSVAGPTTQADRDLAEWPVGIRNIGNTCYLNSLLQFYFSIRPFRDMVLDFEHFKMSIDEESLARKKVGSRKVLKGEVERSQKFLRELRTLFNDMITSPYPSVTPRQELARLTLIGPTNEAAIRRRSTISSGRPGDLGEIDGMPVLGPLGPPQTVADNETRETKHNDMADSAEKLHRARLAAPSDVDSEATLVPEGVRNDIPVAHANEKENEPPSSKDEVTHGQSSSDAVTKVVDEVPPEHVPAAEPPDRPPPVPPRPVPQVDPQKQVIEEVEIGAQQDVTEVINNVLFQSQCAIEPVGFDSDGDQVDLIKDLFYGKLKSYISAQAGLRSKEERFCDINVDVATGSRDIYSAIDGAFDVQKINVDNSVAEQYGSVSKLPPILQIQVQRVQFDQVEKSSFKSTHHLELQETIYLDRYMDTQYSEIMDRRRQCWKWKDTLRSLEARRAELLRKNESDGLDMASIFANAKDVLQDLGSMKEDPETANDAIDFDSQTLSELEQLSQMVKSELTEVEHTIKETKAMLSTQFADYKLLPYRLYAVFIHQGTVEFGHYYIYIYDFKKDVWRKYNDDHITEVHDRDEIFKNHGHQNPPTPYFLVYVNDDIKSRLVDPVHRQIVEPTAPTSGTDQHPPSAESAAAMEGVPVSSSMDLDPASQSEVWTGVGSLGPREYPYSSPPFSTTNPLKRKSVDFMTD